MDDDYHTIYTQEKWIHNWLPSDIRHRTNWLYWVIALHNRYRGEMNIILELTPIFRDCASQFLLWTNNITTTIRISDNTIFMTQLQKVVDIIISLTELLWPGGIVIFLIFTDCILTDNQSDKKPVGQTKIFRGAW